MWQSWIYLVEFAEPSDKPNVPRPFFTTVVLMNGEAVRPKIIELRVITR
jgi:hypothetical protein